MPRHLIISNVLGLVGAIVGGVLGFYTFGWLFHYGFYGLMIPGAFPRAGVQLGGEPSLNHPRNPLWIGRTRPGHLYRVEVSSVRGGPKLVVSPDSSDQLDPGDLAHDRSRGRDRFLGGQGCRVPLVRAVGRTWPKGLKTHPGNRYEVQAPPFNRVASFSQVIRTVQFPKSEAAREPCPSILNALEGVYRHVGIDLGT